MFPRAPLASPKSNSPARVQATGACLRARPGLFLPCSREEHIRETFRTILTLAERLAEEWRAYNSREEARCLLRAPVADANDVHTSLSEPTNNSVL